MALVKTLITLRGLRGTNGEIPPGKQIEITDKKELDWLLQHKPPAIELIDTEATVIFETGITPPPDLQGGVTPKKRGKS